MRERFERWRARRALRKFQPLVPGSPEGLGIYVTGHVRVLHETVIAPLSGIECVIARTAVRGTGRFKNMYSRGWTESLLIKPFVVELREGMRAIVDGSHVVLGVPRLELPSITTERKEAFLAREALRWPASFHETVLVAGALVTVAGVLMRDIEYQPPRDERAFREPLAGVRLLGGADQPLVIVG
jgi:hypothetical protein